MTNQFIKERKYLKAVTPKTLLWYRDSFKAFEGALDSTETINARIVELRKRGVKPVSVNTYLRAVKAYYLWQGKEWKVGRLKEEEKILPTLSHEGLSRLINAKLNGARINEARVHIVALTILDTGLRISEALNLVRSDVDFDSMTMRILGKGNKHRVVPFSHELRKHLWRYTDKNRTNRFIFGTRSQTKLTDRNFLRDFKKLGNRLGITGVRISPHTLRHTFAVNYLKRGGNLEYLRRILGHSSILTTQNYLKSLGVDDLQAVHNGLSVLSPTLR